MSDLTRPSPRVIRRIDWRTMPWKNGGGVTHELLKVGGGAAGFGLRLSIAEVAADGPFSRFGGVDRVIAPLAGNGFRLRRADGLVVTLARLGDAFAFVGEDDWTCALLDGPTTDFNVMTDRATWAAAVTRHAPGPVDAPYVLALGAGRLGALALDAFDLAVAAGPVRATMPTLAVAVRQRATTS